MQSSKQSKQSKQTDDQRAKVAYWLCHLLSTEADSIFYGDYHRGIDPCLHGSPEQELACWLSDQSQEAGRKGDALSDRVTWKDALDAF